MVKKAAAPVTEAPAAPAHVLTSWDDVDNLALRWGQILIEKDSLEAERDAKKSRIDEEYSARVKTLVATAFSMSLAAVKFAHEHANEINRGGTKELNFAVIKRGLGGKSIQFVHGEEHTIRCLKRSSKWRDLITTAEKVAKSDLNKIPAADRHKFGLETVESDPTIEVTPKRDVIRNLASKGGGA